MWEGNPRAGIDRSSQREFLVRNDLKRRGHVRHRTSRAKKCRYRTVRNETEFRGPFTRPATRPVIQSPAPRSRFGSSAPPTKIGVACCGMATEGRIVAIGQSALRLTSSATLPSPPDGVGRASPSRSIRTRSTDFA